MLFKIFKTALTGTVNSTFSITMFFLFAAAIMIIWFERNNNEKGNLYQFARNTPALLTSIGILGTFVGIVIALMGFDDSNIKAHINEIITGMQTAFVTSVMGVALSILLKIIILIISEVDHNEDATDLLKQNNQYLRQQTQAIERLANTIGSDSQNSLIGQMTRLRTDINDNHKNQKTQSQQFKQELFAELDTVSQMISKSATEQVIDALRQVITDFNHNLTEQFGENFKELNEAVFKLVEWQDKYANQIDQMIEQYEQGVQAIDSTKNAVIAIEKSTQSIPQTMTDLSGILKFNQHQINALNRHLQAFADLKDKATQALPETKKHIDEMIRGIDEGATEIGRNFTKINGIIKSQISHTQTFVSDLKSQLEKIAENIKETNQIQLEEMKKLLAGLENAAKQALSGTANSIEEQINSLRKAQEEELTRVMEEMGTALATITAQFTNDYKQLVSEMDKIVRMHN